MTVSVPSFSGVPKSAESLAIATLAQHNPCLIHVAVNDREMETLAQSLPFFMPDAELLLLPAWDAMPYDRVSPNASIMATRLLTLSRLAHGNTAQIPQIILTTANAIIQKLPPRSLLQQTSLSLEKNQSLGQNKVIEALIAQGYHRRGKAMEAGEFALRGSIVDIVAPGMEHGLRIDFFGDDIESIRQFDPMTQTTTGTVDKVTLHPVSEVLLSAQSIERFRDGYRDLFGAVSKEDPLYEAISQGNGWPGMEHWLPLFYEQLDSLFAYAPHAVLSFSAESMATIEERFETIHDYYNARQEALGIASKKPSFAGGAVYNPLPPDRLYLMEASWEQQLQDHAHAICFSPFDDQHAKGQSLECKTVIRFDSNKPFDELQELARTHTKPIIVACASAGSKARMQSLFDEHHIATTHVSRWSDAIRITAGQIGLTYLPLDSGFEGQNAFILTEQDIFGERIIRTTKRKKHSDVFMAEAANFNEGELVTHKEHGIGRFDGLVTITAGGTAHDCLKLLYANDDKLFLPVENIDMIARFGLEEDGVQLDKLGGASWQSRKAKLKQKLLMSAAELIKIAAQRLTRKADIVHAEAGSYEEFCRGFGHVETEDQARAIEEVIDDLQSGKPMDRLVCGDVGFGKTEVALRAAYIASCSLEHKMQVAVIVPTTLLARQHYQNFKERFANFPVEIRQLSRMVSAKDQKQTREDIAAGKVDIVIGTHALLSKQVQFQNLGLLIVDEEQHFGVAQKEKLKNMRSNVHVLTLSATPIPRTLQMSLTGIRDLSLITTPPVDRLAIRSFVMPIDTVIIREAIMRELHRGGRCFVVCPRIKDMAEIKAQITELVPEAKLAVAHGQMPPADLDTIMNQFFDGSYNVLLSTAIIESGLDIPTANTMIIYKSHLFGLAQLYQMRGRVGRGKLRAYAYFLLPHHRQLTKNATRRLEVMQTLDTLGAGFTLASHDMDIRGFGNLVGEEQSGHIREVGVELYQQMLEEAVAQMKAGRNNEPDSDWSPQINLGISVMIPEMYVEDLSLRLGLYRRAGSLQTEDEIHAFAAELTDRFGDMPEEVHHLIATLSLKILCKKAGVERIDVGPKGAVISFRNNSFSNPDALIDYVDRHIRHLKIRPDQKLLLTESFDKTSHTISTLKDKLGDIAKLAA